MSLGKRPNSLRSSAARDGRLAGGVIRRIRGTESWLAACSSDMRLVRSLKRVKLEQNSRTLGPNLRRDGVLQSSWKPLTDTFERVTAPYQNVP